MCSWGCRGGRTALDGGDTLGAMSTGTNAESLAQASAEAAATGTGTGRLVSTALVRLADLAQGSQALLDAGIVHEPRVQVIRQTARVTGGRCVGDISWRFFIVLTVLAFLFGIFFLGGVQIDAAGNGVSG